MMKIVKLREGYYQESDKHLIIQAFLSSNRTKQSIWEEYTGQMEEHGKILKWMRELGYETSEKKRRLPDQSSFLIATKPNQSANNDFEKKQLEKRITELEKQLKDAEMKAIAFSTMVDIAEKEFKINIRKKYSTKP
ncbi:hypothetical protein DVR12_20390 [Chitinophaga silvatica]|uniref:Transposase n=1 Tax=Chitinophaga silvatica TaxID=2282649 RepID=A0A3E1Y5T0_9BACT|nr:hypothetical protein [Chitinophaga silvatica]RFS20081.1 hypothetical protein DVR12_20390 [Chitinophaga silvatica]